jgi:hypothetical protein
LGKGQNPGIPSSIILVTFSQVTPSEKGQAILNMPKLKLDSHYFYAQIAGGILFVFLVLLTESQQCLVASLLPATRSPRSSCVLSAPHVDAISPKDSGSCQWEKQFKDQSLSAKAILFNWVVIASRLFDGKS